MENLRLTRRGHLAVALMPWKNRRESLEDAVERIASTGECKNKKESTAMAEANATEYPHAKFPDKPE